MSSSGASAACTERQVYSIIGFWFQFIIYGAYFTLFLKTLPGSVKHHKKGGRVFVAGNITLFALTTFDTCIKSYTATSAFANPLTEGGSLGCALQRWRRWDTFTSAVMLNLVIWIMDILLLFRCFVIWGRSWRAVVAPSILLLTSIAINSVILCWFSNPGELDNLVPAMGVLRHLCYPISFGVNALTTGLIAYAILEQHFASAAAGAQSTDGLSLVYIARVVVESALIYTLQILVLSILHQFHHPAITIFQTTLTPSVGITFVLMAARVDFTRSTCGDELQSGFTFHSWNSDSTAPKSAESQQPVEIGGKEAVV